MEKEPAKPFVPPETPAEVAEREDVRASSSPVRCPYCHADVSPDARDWVACRKCLARHHASCWRESGACASCRGTEPLAASPRPNRRIQRAVALAFALLAALYATTVMAKWHHTHDPILDEVAKTSADLQADVADFRKAEERSSRLARVLAASAQKHESLTFTFRDANGTPLREVVLPWSAVAGREVSTAVRLNLAAEAARRLIPGFPDLASTEGQRLVVGIAGHELAVREWAAHEPILSITLDPVAPSDADLAALEAAYGTHETQR